MHVPEAFHWVLLLSDLLFSVYGPSAKFSSAWKSIWIQ